MQKKHFYFFPAGDNNIRYSCFTIQEICKFIKIFELICCLISTLHRSNVSRIGGVCMCTDIMEAIRIRQHRRKCAISLKSPAHKKLDVRTSRYLELILNDIMYIYTNMYVRTHMCYCYSNVISFCNQVMCILLFALPIPHHKLLFNCLAHAAFGFRCVTCMIHAVLVLCVDNILFDLCFLCHAIFSKVCFNVLQYLRSYSCNVFK